MGNSPIRGNRGKNRDNTAMDESTGTNETSLDAKKTPVNNNEASTENVDANRSSAAKKTLVNSNEPTPPMTKNDAKSPTQNDCKSPTRQPDSKSTTAKNDTKSPISNTNSTLNATNNPQNNSTTENAQNNNSTTNTTEPKPKRTRRPPHKFIARPSKQGIGVEEGDEAFLNGSVDFMRRGKSVERGVGSNSKSDELKSGGCNSKSVELKSGGKSVELNGGNEQQFSGSGNSQVQITGVKELRKRKKATVASASKRIKTNRGKAKPVRDGGDNNSGMDEKPAFVPRKSAISRRPRQLQPTEKIRAQQEELASKKSDGNKSLAKQKQSASKSSSTAKSNAAKSASTNSTKASTKTKSTEWKCTSCTLLNPPTRKRCSSCQGWRGGVRMNIRSPKNKKRGVLLVRTVVNGQFYQGEKNELVGDEGVTEKNGERNNDGDTDDLPRKRRRPIKVRSVAAGVAAAKSNESKGTKVNATDAKEASVNCNEKVKHGNSNGAKSNDDEEPEMPRKRRPLKVRSALVAAEIPAADNSNENDCKVAGLGKNERSNGDNISELNRAKSNDDDGEPEMPRKRKPLKVRSALVAAADPAADKSIENDCKVAGLDKSERSNDQTSHDNSGDSESHEMGGNNDLKTASVDHKDETAVWTKTNDQTDSEKKPIGDTNKLDAHDDGCNLDDVACCLCKCAVDFGDEYFFLPETAESEVKIENDAEVEVNGSAKAPAKGTLECGASAIVSSENCSVAEGNVEGPPSPNTVIHPRDTDAAGVAAAAGILNGHIMVDSTSVPMDEDGLENTAKVESDNVSPPEVEDERKPSPIPMEAPSGALSACNSESAKPQFQLPRRFYDPGNSLILCDGPEHANRKKNGTQYKCERAYHQLCHFIPVFTVPRGAWRCLICRYRDSEYLRKKALKGEKRKGSESENTPLSDGQLNAIFRVKKHDAHSDISADESTFELSSAPLKAKLLHSELTNRAKSLINTCLANIRTAEHSIRAFTETSKARKALMERIETMGLPQELIQCFARLAQAKMRIKDLIRGVENAINTRQHHTSLDIANEGKQSTSDGVDVVSELMNWSSNQKGETNDPALFNHLFPEGDSTLVRRRVEPRTDEAKADDVSNSSGVSLDNLRCACCLKGHASDDNDLLLCDGLGCYRAYHMNCLEPKLTPDEVAADENEHWFCPMCTAHGLLIHFAQREYLGDEFFSSSPPKEWEKASDVFPEAQFEIDVAQKLKDGIKDDDVNRFLSETLGISVSAQQMTSIEFEEEEDDESDDDFDESEGEEDGDVDDDIDSDEEEQQLGKEKIDKDELDALSLCSEESHENLDNDSVGHVGGRRSRRKRNNMVNRDTSTSDEEDSRATSPLPDAGALDAANIVIGKRNRTKVDYRKLNDAMFGDESDDEAKGADVKFAYKPKAKVQHNSDSSDDSEGEDDSTKEDAKPAAVAPKAKPTKPRPKQTKVVKSKKDEDAKLESDAWSCLKCGNICAANKKRCGKCQGWRGGIRENIRSPAKGKK